MSFHDPIEPPEGGLAMKATDLQNKVCIFRPTGAGEWPAKPAELDEEGRIVKKARGPQPYVECDVWVIDRQGILESGTGVRVSWWKAVAQLQAVPMGEFLMAMPRKEEEGNSIVLIKTSKDDWREAGERAIKEILASEGDPNQTAIENAADYGEEPF